MHRSLVFTKAICVISVLAMLLACTVKTLVAKEDSSIGSAILLNDGTVRLQLRAELSGGGVGDFMLLVRPGEKDYDEIIHHLGGLKPGESKPVPPWPNKSNVSTTPAGSSNHRDCSTDSDCIAVTSSYYYRSCYHIDPQVQEVCRVINRKYETNMIGVECFMNVGCRAVVNISCQQGLCVGEAATLPLSIKDTLGKYGFWSKSENPRCQMVKRNLTNKFSKCIVGEKGTLTGNRYFICSSDKHGDFLIYNTKAACVEDFKALKAAHVLH